MSTPILPLAVWEPGTNQNSIPANDNALRLQLLNGLIISDAVTAQPGSPTNGDAYIMAPGKTGTQWALFDVDDLAIFMDGTWYAYAPVDGITVNIDGELATFDGSDGYVPAGGGGGGGDVVGPVAAVNNNIAVYDGVTGKLIKDGGTAISALATVSYVDGLVQGISWKKAVRAATLVNGTLATAFANGQTIDGVVLATNDRILLKNQTTATENGIYTVNASGVPTRATDADTGAELVNASMFVAEGSQADTQWVCTNDAPITIGSTNLVFVQFGAGGGGSLTGFTSALNTGSPNNTVNASSITASGGSTNQDAVLAAKGTGASLAQIPDNGTGGGNKRGTNATDWQKVRTANTQVASGIGATIAGGERNTAAGQRATVGGGLNNNVQGNTATIGGGTDNQASNQESTVAGGNNNNASGARASILGGISNTASGSGATITGGDTNTASGTNSRAGGLNAHTRGVEGADSYSSGMFANNGDAQKTDLVLRRSTTNATPAVLSSSGGAGSTTNQVLLQNNSAKKVTLEIVARDSVGNAVSWTAKCLIKRGANAAATAIVGTAAVTQDYADTALTGCTIALTADTTNGCLAVTATGIAATNIKWVASVKDVEVVG